ncbi:Bifunctional riboflavin biosynthesis protein RIBA 1 chloroplastic, partial [Bienertia sinuspersici]
VSAKDRAITVKALASGDSKPEDFNRPGHIFPLKYREGGFLKRAGHTEASVNLAMLAGLNPVAVLCEIVDDDGSMHILPRLREFANDIIVICRYRRKRAQLVERSCAVRIPTMWGPFTAYCCKSYLDGIEHIAMVKGETGDASTCYEVDRGCCKEVLVYLRGHEGRGIGLGHKLRAYNLQDAGRDTVEDNEELRLPIDSREYGIGA